MDSIRGFLFTLFAWILLAVCGFTFLQNESIGSIVMDNPSSVQVAPAKYTGTADLTILMGEQIIGMVPSALAGSFTLIINSATNPPISINSATDITTIDLHGIPYLKYSITLIKDGDGKIIITAIPS